jgi:hypothetical protein
MRWLIIFLYPVLLWAQDLTFSPELDSIPVRVQGYQIPVPWTGGYAWSSPDFCDIDGDGDLDLFIGSSNGKVAFYRNDGSVAQSLFAFVTDSFGDINVSDWMGYSKPVFWDMDVDGDYDVFVGSGRSLVRVYRNIGTPTDPVFEVYADTLKTATGNWFYCDRPQLVDIDADGDNDLFCGRYPGTIDFYCNIGDSTAYAFQLVQLGIQGINVGGSSAPEMVDIDADGDHDLFIGNEYGHIWFYRNDGTPQQYDFTFISNNWLGIDVGDNASPEFCDLDGDRDYDLFIGKDNDYQPMPPGALHYWRNDGTPQSHNFVQVTQSYLTFDAGEITHPLLVDIDHDGDLDLFFMTNANLGWMKNIGTSSIPSFQIESFNLLSLPPGSFTCAHLDSDPYPDLITAAGWAGVLSFWHTVVNGGQISFQFISSLNTGYAPGVSLITAGDLDADGVDELLVGGFDYSPGDWILALYENQGYPGHPNFVFQTANYQGLDSVGVDPALSDVDGDGKLDLILKEYGVFYYYHNAGTPQQPNFVLASTNFLGDTLYAPVAITGSDIDADGDWDAFVGAYQGGIKFFRNVTGESPVHPDPKRPAPTHPVITLLPNPGNSTIAASYKLQAASKVSLKVFDITGRLTGTLFYGFQLPGTYSYTWDAREKASGVYILQLDTPNQKATQKITILK